ncbi:hypothetical protein KSP40_PGU020635 [Platanthera guangdongensis]|uniref:Nudix hydrolase domain-containing protein n=1 Tax=Platanthera guangdongensis TaxID=2320717 RepID=A0ABR2N4V6_9ASPA
MHNAAMTVQSVGFPYWFGSGSNPDPDPLARTLGITCPRSRPPVRKKCRQPVRGGAALEIEDSPLPLLSLSLSLVHLEGPPALGAVVGFGGDIRRRRERELSSGLLEFVVGVAVDVLCSGEAWCRRRAWGGWESDETAKQAASREAFEEAGVQGNVEVRFDSLLRLPLFSDLLNINLNDHCFQRKLGNWKYTSSTQAVNEGIMFPLKVVEELIHWPEMSARNRRWVGLCGRSEGRMQASMDEGSPGQISEAIIELDPQSEIGFDGLMCAAMVTGEGACFHVHCLTANCKAET